MTTPLPLVATLVARLRALARTQPVTRACGESWVTCTHPPSTDITFREPPAGTDDNTGAEASLSDRTSAARSAVTVCADAAQHRQALTMAASNLPEGVFMVRGFLL